MEAIHNLYIITVGTTLQLAFLSDAEADLASDVVDLSIVGAIWDADRIQNYKEELKREAGIGQD